MEPWLKQGFVKLSDAAVLLQDEHPRQKEVLQAVSPTGVALDVHDILVLRCLLSQRDPPELLHVPIECTT